MPKQWTSRSELYKHLHAHSAEIYAEMRRAGEEIGLGSHLQGGLGLTGAISACHALLGPEVSQAMDAAARKVIPSANLDERLREIIKEHYGDEYDAALVNTCEAGLAVCFETLCMPPLSGRGEGYRGCYLAPYERFLEHHTSYGRPFPPKYKELNAERGETAGEYGISGKRPNNLDVVLVRMAGASYPNHGIKYDPIPDLAHVDAQATVERFTETAGRHRERLVGISSLGYDTPGYGYGELNADGAPKLITGLAKLARQYDVPYIVDNAWGMPMLGADIRKLGCDVMVYSMDKVSGSPTCGLIIGKEEVMVLVRRALGIHGARYGSLSSHGKAAYVGYDAGKEALSGTIAALEVIRDHPEKPLAALDRLEELVRDEFNRLPEPLRDGWHIFKSINAMAVELNYQDTWKNGKTGIPIFSMEDMYSGSHLIQFGLSQMGLMPTVAFDANILVSNGLGNLDEAGRLLEEPTRKILRGLFKSIEIVSRYAGLV